MCNEIESNSYIPNIRPASPWITRFGRLISKGEILDLACGSGRHGRWFLQRGIQVTFLDRNIKGLDDISGSPGVEIILADIESELNLPITSRRFECVVVTNYLWRDILNDICRIVDHGGLLLYETFGAGNEKFGSPKNSDYLLKPGELLNIVPSNFRIIGYEHGLRTEPSKAIIQRIAAVRE